MPWAAVALSVSTGPPPTRITVNQLRDVRALPDPSWSTGRTASPTREWLAGRAKPVILVDEARPRPWSATPKALRQSRSSTRARDGEHGRPPVWMAMGGLRQAGGGSRRLGERHARCCCRRAWSGESADAVASSTSGILWPGQPRRRRSSLRPGSYEIVAHRSAPAGLLRRGGALT
jgi:hypothetical protein